jgi:hypothetical protein
MSTVTKSIQKNSYNDEYKKFDVNCEMIEKILPNCVYEIFDEEEIFEPNIANTNKMFYHWKNAFRLMKESNKDYDVIMVTRTDNAITMKQSYDIKNWVLRKDRIYGDPLYLTNINPYEFAAHDRFFFGHYEPISKFLNNIPDTSKDVIFDCHMDLANCILNSGLYVSENHQFSHCIIRPQ